MTNEAQEEGQPPYHWGRNEHKLSGHRWYTEIQWRKGGHARGREKNVKRRKKSRDTRRKKKCAMLSRSRPERRETKTANRKQIGKPEISGEADRNTGQCNHRAANC